ncbi:MAG: phage tail tape measure protein [Caulobacter sp.]|nr:phage tail tape measure protein [Caulobacter sp.]
MAENAVVGALRVVLGIDTANFDEGLKNSQRDLARAGSQFKRIGNELSGIGGQLSAALSLPLAALGVGVIKTAANFESAMGRVSIATKASTAEMTAMEAKAREIGKTTVFSASEAATAMELLAKTGVSTADILNGAAKATVDLAAATGAGLDPAAAAVADSMNQFGLSAAQLPSVVNQITGAVNKSKLDFADFQMAMGQAGGVAANVGVSFSDFNAVLAGTSPLFSSGSDAGTSFKVFLTALVPTTKDAAEGMKALGLEFFNADGSMKSMGEVAEELKTGLGGLSDQARNRALKDIFGTDGMRTAIALMSLGSDGLARIRGEIAKTNAAAQAAQRMAGFNGQLEQLKGAFEELAIAIGKSGLLSAMSAMVGVLGKIVDLVSTLPAPVMKMVTGFAAVAAVVGPLVVVGGQMMVVWGSLLTLGGVFTPVWLAVGATLLRVAGSATVAGAAARALGAAMSFAAGPWGLAIMAVVVALAVLISRLNQAKVASAQVAAATDALAKASSAYEKAALAAASASDKERDAALRNAAAKKEEAAQTLRAAKAKLADARAALINAKASVAKNQAALDDPTNADYKTRTAVGQVGNDLLSRAAQAKANADALQASVDAATAQIESADAIISAAANAPTLGSAGGSYNPAGDAGGKSKGQTEAELKLRREEIELQARLDAARAAGDLATEQSLERQLDLIGRRQAYESAGLGTEAAKVAALRDQSLIDKARDQARKIALADQERQVALTVAEIDGNYQLVEQYERGAELARLKAFYLEQEGNALTAAALAMRDMLRIDEARLKNRERLLAQARAERDLELARLRGESEARLRELERAAEQQRRADEIFQRDPSMGRAGAERQAKVELDEEDAARLQGKFRDVIKGGFRAAMDGDLEGFAKDWIADWASRGLEEALNSLSDLLFDLFKDVFKGVGSGSEAGGFSLGQVFGSIFGDCWGAGDFGLPGFATGGSFTVGGSGGIDSQIRAMRLTPGERVSVSKGDAANDNRAPVVFDLRGAVMTDDLLKQMNDISLRHSAAVYGQVQTDKVKAARSAPYRKTR